MGAADVRPRYCVIGAGAAGLAVARNFKQYGIAFDIFDRHDDVGGMWGYGRPYSAVYASTRLISSKSMSAFRGFALPKALPDYPGHEAVFLYMKSYADQFDLRDHITFSTEVCHISRIGEHWEIELDSGERRIYGGLVLASGIAWDPNFPEIPGLFTGRVLHSFEYKTPEQFSGTRVLVVGGGNSGCDIAAELGNYAKQTFLSVRRGYHFIPRYVFGLPSDKFGEKGLLASGIAWDPNFPEIPGLFTGRVLHSFEYKTPEQFSGTRVLVVGGGNSGCDIAAELGNYAKQTFLSVRLCSST